MCSSAKHILNAWCWASSVHVDTPALECQPFLSPRICSMPENGFPLQRRPVQTRCFMLQRLAAILQYFQSHFPLPPCSTIDIYSSSIVWFIITKRSWYVWFVFPVFAQNHIVSSNICFMLARPRAFCAGHCHKQRQQFVLMTNNAWQGNVTKPNVTMS